MDTIEKDNNPQHQDMTDTSTIDATEAAGEKKKSPRKIVFILSVVAVLVVVGIVGGVILSGMQVISIRAEYTGPLSVGTVLDNANSNIIVIGRTKNGDNVTIAQGDWGISSPKTLEADKTAVVRIAYNDLFCELTVNCEDSNVASITAYYDGELKAGTVISNITDGLHVMATYKNGTNTDVTNQCAIENGPITLEADKTTVIKVSYVDPVNNKRFTTEFSVSCTTKTVRKIIVKYVGNADAGEILDENNEWIIVTAMYQNGDYEHVTGWTVKEPATLENSQIASVYVSYEGFTEKLTVECKTIDPDTYRKNCSKVNYNDLARSPEEYENKMVKISGKIIYINSNANTASGYIYKIDAGQGKYLNVAFNGDAKFRFCNSTFEI